MLATAVQLQRALAGPMPPANLEGQHGPGSLGASLLARSLGEWRAALATESTPSRAAMATPALATLPSIRRLSASAPRQERWNGEAAEPCHGAAALELLSATPVTPALGEHLAVVAGVVWWCWRPGPPAAAVDDRQFAMAAPYPLRYLVAE